MRGRDRVSGFRTGSSRSPVALRRVSVACSVCVLLGDEVARDRRRSRRAPSRAPASVVDRMRAASRPALRAPPIETVATGMPAGICTIESSESRPSSCASGTGTPMTGSVVTEASMPGRCAAPPAPAMMTRMPRPAAADAERDHALRRAVRRDDLDLVRDAELGRASAAASAMTVQSESDPMTTATTGAGHSSPASGAVQARMPWYGSVLEERRRGTRPATHVVEVVAGRR